jgi:DDE family transposase/transposase-like protein DUF772
MSFVSNPSQQISFNDNYNSLTDREKRFLDKSWAKPFAEEIFPAINEDVFSVLYSKKASRPNTPVNVIVGSLIIKEILNMTDDEIVEALMFDIRFQYALHTTSFKEQPLSDRTLGRFRERCNAYETEYGKDLVKEAVLLLADKIAKVMNLNPTLKRMDSMMIASNIKKMSRLELLYSCVANMVKCLHEAGDDEIIKGLEHYYDENDRNKVIYHNRSKETSDKIQVVINDAIKLLPLIEDKYLGTSEYQLLIRVFKEQTTDDGNGSRKLREGKELNSQILQNPADPDATYRKKAGKETRGYSANLVETFDGTNSVITDYQYENSIHSDSRYCKETINTMGIQEEKTTIIADGAYGGEANRKLATQNNIDLVTTDFQGKKPNEIFSDFIFSEDGKELLECANGQKPTYNKYNETTGQCRAKMNLEKCQSCPHIEECNPKLQRKSAIVVMSSKTVQRAKMLKTMKTEEFQELAKKRNGVEALPSILRRKYDVDNMPVRGKVKTKLYFGFKIGALNFRKLCKFFQSSVQRAPKLAMNS